jgi:hypothetical protein
VFKSGARTGLTFAVITAITPVSTRLISDDPEDGVNFWVNQVRFGEDPDQPNGVSDSGDSGSLWVQRTTGDVVALNHAGSREANTATGTRIQDVLRGLDVRLA